MADKLTARRLIASLGFAAVVGLAASAANAQQLVVNPSFESNTNVQAFAGSPNAIPGWTFAGPCSAYARPSPQGSVIASPPPTDGLNVLEMTAGGSGGSNTTCTLFQDVTIPASATSATLSYATGANFRNGPNANSQVRFEVIPPIGPTLTPYTRLSSAGADVLAARTPVDLIAYKGQVVRLRYVYENGSNNFYDAYMDNVRVTAGIPAPVPTMSEWAMILFGLILAGGATLYIQRRRYAA